MAPKKRFWVWVTGPNYYFDEAEQDRDILDPKSGIEAGGWWTCHKDTQAGDLVLLYRTRPKSDIAYLLEAKSAGCLLVTKPGKDELPYEDFDRLANQLLAKDKKFAKLLDEVRDRDETLDDLKSVGAEYQVKMSKKRTPPEPGSFFDQWNKWASSQRKKWLREETLAVDLLYDKVESHVLAHGRLPKNTRVAHKTSEWDGSFVCDWKPRFKFDKPLTLSELKSDPFLSKEWGALRAGFRMRSYEIPERVWGHLVSKIQKTNSGFAKIAQRLQGMAVSADILSEKEFEESLITNLQAFRPDYDLEIYVDEDGRNGRQYPCVDAGGFIDLLCRDRVSGGLVVVELKVARVGRDVVGQIASYMGWVQKHLADKKPVSGLIVGKGYDEKFRFAHTSVPGLKFMELEEIRKRLK